MLQPRRRRVAAAWSMCFGSSGTAAAKAHIWRTHTHKKAAAAPFTGSWILRVAFSLSLILRSLSHSHSLEPALCLVLLLQGPPACQRVLIVDSNLVRLNLIRFRARIPSAQVGSHKIFLSSRASTPIVCVLALLVTSPSPMPHWNFSPPKMSLYIHAPAERCKPVEPQWGD